MVRILFLFLFILPLCLKAQFKIVIDPGHGGVDVGATRDSFTESDIVYKIAEKMKDLLNQKTDVEAVLTRQSNKGLSLPQRVQIANDLKADLFLSLHANSSNSSLVSGMEFYFSSPQIKTASRATTTTNPENIVQKIKEDLIEFGKLKSSLELSHLIQENTLDQKSVIRRAPFYVIENTSMPSVLVEVGFISNRREAKKLATESYQLEIAKLLTLAILDYKEKSDKTQAMTEK